MQGVAGGAGGLCWDANAGRDCGAVLRLTLYGTQASAEGPVTGEKATCSRETQT